MTKVEDRAKKEAAAARRAMYTGEALEYRLEDALKLAGYKLGGVNIKIGSEDVFLTIKVPTSGEGPLVAFQGGKTIGSALRTFLSQLQAGKVRFKGDKWALAKFDKNEDDW